MTTQIRVNSEFRSHLREPRLSAARPSKRREPVIGFTIGLVGILTAAFGTAALYGADTGMIWSHLTALAGR